MRQGSRCPQWTSPAPRARRSARAFYRAGLFIFKFICVFTLHDMTFPFMCSLVAQGDGACSPPLFTRPTLNKSKTSNGQAFFLMGSALVVVIFAQLSGRRAKPYPPP